MGELTGSKTIDPPRFGGPPGSFTVSSGPCTVSDSGRCVGRPAGYLWNERCVIAVGGGGGVLGPCGVFGIHSFNGDPMSFAGSGDYVTLPDGSTHFGFDCPVGAILAPDDNVGWHAGRNAEAPGARDVGWQICFA